MPRSLGCQSLSRLPRTALMWMSRFTSWCVKSCFSLRGARMRSLFLEPASLTRSVTRFERYAVLAPTLQWCGHIDFDPISCVTCTPVSGLLRALRRQSVAQEMGQRVHHNAQQLIGVWQHHGESCQQSAKERQFSRWTRGLAHRWLRVHCSCS